VRAAVMMSSDQCVLCLGFVSSSAAVSTRTPLPILLVDGQAARQRREEKGGAHSSVESLPDRSIDREGRGGFISPINSHALVL
jgi:hypothetical protein